MKSPRPYGSAWHITLKAHRPGEGRCRRRSKGPSASPMQIPVSDCRRPLRQRGDVGGDASGFVIRRAAADIQTPVS